MDIFLFINSSEEDGTIQLKLCIPHVHIHVVLCQNVPTDSELILIKLRFS